MGYDYRNNTTDLYTSYNHAWAFYAYLDEKEGIRWIYGKKGKDITKRLEVVLESLEKLIEPDTISYTRFGSYTDSDKYGDFKELGYFGKDCWDVSDPNTMIKNAHVNAKKILMSATLHPSEVWNGD